MQVRLLGNSDIQLSALGLGCWAFGGGDYWGAQDARQEDSVVGRALELGINYFDTAEGYNEGRSEEALGRALKGRRQQAVIGTKVAPSNCEPSTLRQHCEASLRRLGTDWIDLYMVHWPISDRPIEPAFNTLRALQAEGKVRRVGVSNYGVRQLQEAVESGAPIAANELCYNLLSRSIEWELMPICENLGIGILAYSPLMQGLLTGRFASPDEMPAVRTRTRHFQSERVGSRHGEAGFEAEVFNELKQIQEVTDELQVSAGRYHMAQVAIAWILTRPVVTSVIAGARSLEQLEQNAAGASLSLLPGVVERLDSITEPLKRMMGTSVDYYQASEGGRSW